MDESVDSENFSVRGYLPLIKKNSSTHMHGLTLYYTEYISRKLCRFLLMFLTGFTSFSIILIFSLSITFFVFVHGF